MTPRRNGHTPNRSTLARAMFACFSQCASSPPVDNSPLKQVCNSLRVRVCVGCEHAADNINGATICIHHQLGYDALPPALAARARSRSQRDRTRHAGRGSGAALRSPGAGCDLAAAARRCERRGCRAHRRLQQRRVLRAFITVRLPALCGLAIRAGEERPRRCRPVGLACDGGGGCRSRGHLGGAAASAVVRGRGAAAAPRQHASRGQLDGVSAEAFIFWAPPRMACADAKRGTRRV